MMVQGVSRQVIVVRSPDPRFFEQAIFIVKEDAFKKGVTADEVLQEARRAAGRLSAKKYPLEQAVAAGAGGRSTPRQVRWAPPSAGVWLWRCNMENGGHPWVPAV